LVFLPWRVNGEPDGSAFASFAAPCRPADDLPASRTAGTRGGRRARPLGAHQRPSEQGRQWLGNSRPSRRSTAVMVIGSPWILLGTVGPPQW